jgi:tight adherence protein B
MITDYRKYRLNSKEKIICLIEGMFLNILISVLFFDSFWALIPGMLIVIGYFQEKKRKFAENRLYQCRTELKEFLNIMIAALQTGRSIENAFSEAVKDISVYLKKDTVFLSEMKRIVSGNSRGEALEKQLQDFAYRSHLEELEYFAEVLVIGERSGGNLVWIMKNTIQMIQERMEAEEELHTILTEKQMEFRIMSIMPIAIILYLRVSGGNIMNSLYGNLQGITVMTICLLVYGGCYLYGKRLLEISGG